MRRFLIAGQRREFAMTMPLIRFDSSNPEIVWEAVHLVALLEEILRRVQLRLHEYQNNDVELHSSLFVRTAKLGLGDDFEIPWRELVNMHHYRIAELRVEMPLIPVSAGAPTRIVRIDLRDDARLHGELRIDGVLVASWFLP
jgi:hypothetical protein